MWAASPYCVDNTPTGRSRTHTRALYRLQSTADVRDATLLVAMGTVCLSCCHGAQPQSCIPFCSALAESRARQGERRGRLSGKGCGSCFSSVGGPLIGRGRRVQCLYAEGTVSRTETRGGGGGSLGLPSQYPPPPPPQFQWNASYRSLVNKSQGSSGIFFFVVVGIMGMKVKEGYSSSKRKLVLAPPPYLFWCQ